MTVLTLFSVVAKNTHTLFSSVKGETTGKFHRKKVHWFERESEREKNGDKVTHNSYISTWSHFGCAHIVYQYDVKRNGECAWLCSGRGMVNQISYIRSIDGLGWYVISYASDMNMDLFDLIIIRMTFFQPKTNNKQTNKRVWRKGHWNRKSEIASNKTILLLLTIAFSRKMNEWGSHVDQWRFLHVNHNDPL